MVLRWTPRLLGAAFVVLTLLLSADAAAPRASITENLLAMAMHLIPSLVAAGLLLTAWEWELAGGLLYLAAGIAYAAWVASAGRPLAWTAVIAAPLLVVGLLFVLDWTARRRNVHA